MHTLAENGTRNPFARTRQDHSRETAEDYVEMIDDLIQEHGEARAVDLAERLGISQVAVSRTVARLTKEGFLASQPYRAIFLTDKGQDLAAQARRRHEIVLAVLVKMGVSPETAHTDAEGIEHHVSAETLEAFRRFVEDGA